MHAHLPHTLIYAGLCALPLLIWVPLRLWAPETPRNEEEPGDCDDGESEREPDADPLPVAA